MPPSSATGSTRRTSRLRDFIRNVYLPKCRDSVGLGEMPGGAALYRYLVESNTTTT